MYFIPFFNNQFFSLIAMAKKNLDAFRGQDKNWLHMTSTEQTVQVHLAGPPKPIAAKRAKGERHQDDDFVLYRFIMFYMGFYFYYG